MRFMLMLHGTDAEYRSKPPEWVEEVVGFLTSFEDGLATRSELEWTEVLGPDARAEVVGPGGATREGWYDEQGEPLRRIWVIRVPDRERAVELAELLAGELDAWVEVRECLPGAQRP
ncbi:hypothetical protein D3248_14465 [Leucobacter zeae]|nr:hypothetical protein [Leucobacter zeae]